MSSTIAGNLTILGVASNIIILEVLESRIGITIAFTEFLKVGGYSNPYQYLDIPTVLHLVNSVPKVLEQRR
jgi:Na+/H+ antiporter NhaD/arsenite permease-like protein